MKTDFVAFAAHQLKTPEAEIKAYVDNLLDGFVGHLTQEQKQQLLKIKEINTANIRLVAELLNVSKLERGQVVCEVAPVTLKELGERAAQDYIALIQGKGLHFQAGDGKKIIVLADVPKAIEAIKNTLDNAVRFTDQGSIAIKIKDENYAGIIEVTDTGPGIPNHILSKLFSKKLVLDNPRPRGGSGLGLYIAKSFMKLQGGDLTVSTTMGKGSTFIFKFPKPDKEKLQQKI